jgi:hypothetical protein
MERLTYMEGQMTPSDDVYIEETRLLRGELGETRRALESFASSMRTWHETRCADHKARMDGFEERERDRDSDINKFMGKMMAYASVISVVVSVIGTVVSYAIIKHMGG